MSLSTEGIAMHERSLPLPRAKSGRRHNSLQAGQVVEVSSGVLAGLSGVLVRSARGSRWIVRVDGLQRGVVLAIEAAALIRRRSELAASGQGAPLRHRRPGQRRLSRTRK
jgi:hypothetical protein